MVGWRLGRASLHTAPGLLCGPRRGSRWWWPTPRRCRSCSAGDWLPDSKAALPDAEQTACDLERDGVDFCASEFGARPVYSDEDLNRVSFDTAFDLIWRGSLLTHLDVNSWLAYFKLLARCLAPGGVAVITTHGRWAAYSMAQGKSYGPSDQARERVLSDYRQSGFGSADYEAGAGYGISLSSAPWVLKELHDWQHLRVVSLVERQWDDHQDVLAVPRVSS